MEKVNSSVFVIGSGAREHALAWKIGQSSRVENIFCAPGNAGTASIAKNIDISADDPQGLLEFAKKERIGLTVVGPEIALEKGVVGMFKCEGLRIFGHPRKTAELETSKIFAKAFMQRHGIPTANYETFYPGDARFLERFIDGQKGKLVIKEDGLASGKGVMIVDHPKDAIEFGIFLMKQGKKVVIEEYLEGIEVSTTAVCRGNEYVPLLVSLDHKPLYKGGPNTGGMGVIAPLPFIDAKTERDLFAITEKTIEGASDEGLDISGVLYPNMMLTPNGIKVLEFNMRFGDPEAQVLMKLYTGDIMDLLDMGVESAPRWLKNKYGVSLTIASGGYAQSDEMDLGHNIEGIEDAEKIPGVTVFHGGTSKKDGKIINNGGRVLSVTAIGDSVKLALSAAKYAASKIHFEGMYYRQDLGDEVLKMSYPPVPTRYTACQGR